MGIGTHLCIGCLFVACPLVSQANDPSLFCSKFAKCNHELAQNYTDETGIKVHVSVAVN